MEICKVDRCYKTYKAQGLCSMHLSRLLRHGDINYQSREYHGLTKSIEHNLWLMMKDRCYNPNNKNYPRYGGRGIIVCKRWRTSFTAFLKDMGKRPFLKAQIDRINNDGNYGPGNCRWVTAAENCHNTRKNVFNWFIVRSIRRLYSIHKYSRKELCLIYNVNINTIQDIIYNKTWKE